MRPSSKNDEAQVILPHNIKQTNCSIINSNYNNNTWHMYIYSVCIVTEQWSSLQCSSCYATITASYYFTSKISVRIFYSLLLTHTNIAVQYIKVKSKGLGTCYSATYTSQTRDQQRFAVSEVAADWHEPVVPQRIMWPSIVDANRQLECGTAIRCTTAPISHTGPSPHSPQYV